MVEDIPSAQLHEMLRSSSGVVTALGADDVEAVRLQIMAITNEQLKLSDGDSQTFVFRMAKQLEASARVTHHVLKTLAPTLGLSERETQQVLAEAWNTEL